MVGFMSYYDLPDDGYLPCELAAVEYSLNGGILRRMHYFLPPGFVTVLHRKYAILTVRNHVSLVEIFQVLYVIR